MASSRRGGWRTALRASWGLDRRARSLQRARSLRPDPARSATASLSAASFQSSECNPGVAVDFDLCFTNRTGDLIRRFNNIHWIHAHVNAFSGSVVHSMWHRAGLFGNLQLINSEPANGSSFVSVFRETDNGDSEVWITSAAGDDYHLAMHGDF